MRRLYLTTTLPYVNANPHIGFALELVQADALVRFWKAGGHEVFFNTGTDEHGQKILEAAEKANKRVEEYVAHYTHEFRKLKETLGLSEDLHFIRTTDEHHVRAAQEIWRRCEKDIYKKTFEGLYCIGCERFLTRRDIENGVCVIHKTEPKLLKEENYFFKLSHYQKQLEEYLQNPNVIIPEWRREEALAFVREGLDDFSISREKRRLSWGIPVPGDDAQVMYVWFDALTNYISTLGWPEDTDGNFKKFWEEGHVVQMAGKDQVRFQSIMWQAMLLSAGIKNTDQVFYHGFITSGGQKMSKSLGNVISPHELVKKYGTEATRYLLLRHIHSTEDSDVTWEKLDEWYTAGLVNGIGNLASRILKMSETYLSKPIKEPNLEGKFPESIHGYVEHFEFNQYVEHVWKEIQLLDERIASSEPFRLAKTDLTQAQSILQSLLESLYVIAHELEPALPETSKKIKHAILANKKPENLFPRLG